MAFSLIPDQYRSGIYDLRPVDLAAAGIRLVMADLDNTLVPYKIVEPTPELRAWKQALEEQGITLFVVSNSRRPTRVKEFCTRLGVPYVGHSGKPGTKGFETAFRQTGYGPEQAVMVGDQIFTDILGGNRAGVTTVLIHPIAFGTIFRIIRFGIETPFRLLCPDRKGGPFRKGNK